MQHGDGNLEREKEVEDSMFNFYGRKTGKKECRNDKNGLPKNVHFAKRILERRPRMCGGSKVPFLDVIIPYGIEGAAL